MSYASASSYSSHACSTTHLPCHTPRMSCHAVTDHICRMHLPRHTPISPCHIAITSTILTSASHFLKSFMHHPPRITHHVPITIIKMPRSYDDQRRPYSASERKAKLQSTFLHLLGSSSATTNRSGIGLVAAHPSAALSPSAASSGNDFPPPDHHDNEEPPPELLDKHKDDSDDESECLGTNDEFFPLDEGGMEDDVDDPDHLYEQFLIERDIHKGRQEHGTSQPAALKDDSNNAALSLEDLVSLDLLSLCDSSGARRGLYDDLLAVLRRILKTGFDLRKAKGRNTFLSDMKKKFQTPDPKVQIVQGREVVYFEFLEMLEDLLKSNIFDDVSNLTANERLEDRFRFFMPDGTDLPGHAEIMANEWARATLESLVDFHPETDFFLPLILYGDQTGTDVFQRYSLEPWMFTVALLRCHARENSDAWRHLGFVPAVGRKKGNANESSGVPQSEDPHKNMQLYHDFLLVLLGPLKDAQLNKPIMEVNIGGRVERRRLHIHLAIIMGDQKSQDNICARKQSNTYSASRIHRTCMTSGLAAADGDINKHCGVVDPQVVDFLRDVALIPIEKTTAITLDGPQKTIATSTHGAAADKQKALQLLQRQVRLSDAILQKAYTMYPIRNAFDGMLYGANVHRQYLATVDDHLHATEGGMLLNVAETGYNIMTEKPRRHFERIVRRQMSTCQSSAMSQLPRMKTTAGFSSLTLMTHSEKVGALLQLLVGLHDEEGREIFTKSLMEQQKKYLTFPSMETIKEAEAKAKKKRKRTVDITAGTQPNDDEPMARSDDELHQEDDELVDKEPESNQPLPPSAFPYYKDLLFFKDQKTAERQSEAKNEKKKIKKSPFDRSDSSIEWLCTHLHRHGLGCLLKEDPDELQLERLVIEAWAVLGPLKDSNADPYPSEDFLLGLQLDNDLLFRDVHTTPPTSSQLEQSCKEKLRRMQKNAHDEMIPYDFSIPVPGCVSKHRRQRPNIPGMGYTGAILSDLPTFVAFIEYLLVYHAWCHYSSHLPVVKQKDIPTVDFGCMRIVTYFDTICYLGDNTSDTDTCKTHSQLHNTHSIDYFGGLMQYNCAMGERGLKFWAKGISRTAKKHGAEKFTFGTSLRIAEKLLLDTVADRVKQIRRSEQSSGLDQTALWSLRKAPHFQIDHKKADSLVAVDRWGKARQPDAASGRIDKLIQRALQGLTRKDGLDPIDIWCEARNSLGEIIRCWPEYRSGMGPKYEWAMVAFDSGTDSDGNQPPPETFPAKVLSLFKDGEGELQALLWPASYKMSRGSETEWGDTRLITHYRLEWRSNGEPLLYSQPFKNVQRSIVVFEAKKYDTPLPPPNPRRPKEEQRKHTIMVLRPRKLEWANLFLEWTEELENRSRNVEGDEKFSLIW